MMPEPVVAIPTAITASMNPPTMNAAPGRFGSWRPITPRNTPAITTGKNVAPDTIAVRRGLLGTTSARVNTLKPAKISDSVQMRGVGLARLRGKTRKISPITKVR